jgi:hypothetical protein
MGVTVSRSSSDVGGRAAVRRPFAAPRPDAGAASAIHLQLERLTRTNAGGHPVVSCYLKLEPRDRSRGKYLIKIKNRVKRAKAALPQLVRDRSAQEAVARDLDRVLEHLRSPANLPGAQGLAIFASEGIGLFEVTPMPLIHRSRLAVNGTPLVRELAAMEDAFGSGISSPSLGNSLPVTAASPRTGLCLPGQAPRQGGCVHFSIPILPSACWGPRGSIPRKRPPPQSTPRLLLCGSHGNGRRSGRWSASFGSARGLAGR